MRTVKNILPTEAVQDSLLGKDRLSKCLNDICVLDCWELNKPVIMEDISPGLEEDLTPEVDDRQVPVGVPSQW